MNYTLIEDVIKLCKQFENQNNNFFSENIEGFKKWIIEKNMDTTTNNKEIYWEGKVEGRSIESVINTQLVHLNKYAKMYMKSAMLNSMFTSQDECFYLITLKTYGAMSKMNLIKKNIQDKPTGILIINRLLKQGLAEQKISTEDKRTKIIAITAKGLKVIDKQLVQIRKASKIVTGNLEEYEKKQLVYLLSKLENFHHTIYEKNYTTNILLQKASENYLQQLN